MNYKFIIFFLFFYSSFSIAQKPVNDECADAILLTVNPNETCGTSHTISLKGATNSTAKKSCTADILPAEDTWYKFTATNISHQFVISNVQPAVFQELLVLEVYESCSGSLKTCLSMLSFPDGKIELVNTFETGKTYTIRVTTNLISATNMSFKLCIQTLPSPPANDICKNAINLDINPTLTPVKKQKGTLHYAGSTDFPERCIWGGTDVWYSFVATDSRQKIIVNNFKNLTDPKDSIVNFAVYSGNCDNLKLIYCYTGVNFISPSTIYGLKKGEKYYVQCLFPKFGDVQFDIAAVRLPPAPANDEATTATLLEANKDKSCQKQVAGTTLWSSPSFILQPFVKSKHNNFDVWYRFKANSPRYAISLRNVIPVKNAITAIIFEIYASKNGKDSLLFESKNPYGEDILEIFETGTNYLIRVLQDPTDIACFFDICLQEKSPIYFNSTCERAKKLPFNPTFEGLDYLQEDNIEQQTYLSASDVFWYEFIATADIHVIQVKNWNTVFHISGGYSQTRFWEGACPQPQFIDRLITRNYKTELKNLVIGKKYFISVEHYNGDRATFEIALTAPYTPNNLTCATAKQLLVNIGEAAIEVEKSTFLNANIEKIDTNCAKNSHYLWYVFDIKSEVHDIQLKSSALLNSFGFEVYAGNSCQDLKWLTCGNGNVPNRLGGLAIGKKIFLKIYANTPADFYLSVTTPLGNFAPNDYCKNALEFPVIATDIPQNTDYQIFEIQKNTISYQYNLGCVSGTSGDAWFKFKASSTKHFLNVKDFSGNRMNLQVYKGSCENLVIQECNPKLSISNMDILHNLTPDSTYYLRWQSGENLIKAVVSTNTAANLANDECQKAENILISDASFNKKINFKITNATPSILGESPDIWYKFKAEQAIMHFSLKEKTQTSDFLTAEMYENDCNNLKKIQEIGTHKLFPMINLTVGKEYLIRIKGENIDTSTYTLAIAKAPILSNDDCANPLTLNIDNSNAPKPIYQSLLWATKDPNDTLGCDTRPWDNDLWYQFTATVPQVLLRYDNLKTSYPNTWMSTTLLDGANCSQLHTLNCYYNNATISNLTIGQKYWLKIHANVDTGEGDINFLLSLRTPTALTNEGTTAGKPLPPTNITCDKAIEVPVNQGLVKKDTLKGTTSTNGVNTTLWYKFKAISKRHIIHFYQPGGAYSYPVTAYFNNPNNNKTVAPACADFPITDTIFTGTIGRTPFLDNLIPNQIYYFTVETNDFNPFKYVAAVTTVTQQDLPNVTCAKAAPLKVNDTNTCSLLNSISTDGATDIDNRDVWYSFVAQQTHYTFEISNLKDEPSNIFSGIRYEFFDNCNNKIPIKNANSQFQMTANIGALEIGKTYYFHVISGYQSIHSFDLCVKANPNIIPNDDCATAQNAISTPIQAKPIANKGTFKNSSSNANVFQCGNSYSNEDVWYKFKATASTYYIYIKNNLDLDYLDYEIYEGTACNQLIFKACGAGMDSINAKSGFVPNKDYYIRIYDKYEFIDFDFDLFLLATSQNSPINDECQNAITLIPSSNDLCQNPIEATTLDATFSKEKINCSVYPSEDIWFQFTASADFLEVIFTDNQILTGYGKTNLIVELLQGNCNNLSNIFCASINDYPNYIIPLTNLTKNTTYFLRIYNTREFVRKQEKFKVCITTPIKPANDFCDGAINIPANDSTLLIKKVSATFKYATPEIVVGSKCEISVPLPDIWFSFTATSERHEIIFKTAQQIEYELWEGNNCTNKKSMGCNYLPYLKVGQQYFVRIKAGVNPNVTNFDIYILRLPRIPSNDECKGAIELPINQSFTCDKAAQGNTSNSTFSNFGDNCWYEADNDVWFTFTATQSRHIVSMTDLEILSGKSNKIEYVLYEANSNNQCANNMYKEACVSNPTYPFNIFNTIIGKRYFIKVYALYQNDYSKFRFKMCVLSPPENDEPIAAVSLSAQKPSGTGVSIACPTIATGSTSGATYSNQIDIEYASDCQFENIAQIPRDIWFKTTLSNAGKGFYFNFITMPNNAKPIVAAYKLVNKEYIFIASICKSDTIWYQPQSDEDIYLRVWDYSGKVTGTYDICVRQIQKTIALKNEILNNDSNVSIYPIPVYDELQIEMKEVLNNATIYLYSIEGKLIFHKKMETLAQTSIEMMNFPTGTYILTIEHDAKKIIRKVIKM